MRRKIIPLAALIAWSAAAPPDAAASTLGFAVRAGGRYDDVRMCVATPAGVTGGPAADVSLFAEIPLEGSTSLHLNVPFMRPILFAAAFEMLQFEPEIGLLLRRSTRGPVDVIGGPTLGVSLHYGPDYRSGPSGSGRRESFFAMGPQVGAYLGLDFRRPGERFNFQLGVSPYVTPLFGVDDPEGHRGFVAGATLDALFRYPTRP